MTLLIVVLVLWAASGVGTAIWLRRRGHDFVSWAAMGCVLGPFLVPLARIRAREERVDARVTSLGVPMPGDLSVLVGVDGSPESLHALEQAVALFGDRLGQLTVATVVDFETANEIKVDVLPSAERDRVVDVLQTAVKRVAPLEPETLILSGRPHVALAAAASDGYDVLVIGPRGHGRAEAMFGSAATALSRGTGVPVLIVSPTVERVPADATG